MFNGAVPIAGASGVSDRVNLKGKERFFGLCAQKPGVNSLSFRFRSSGLTALAALNTFKCVKDGERF